MPSGSVTGRTFHEEASLITDGVCPLCDEEFNREWVRHVWQVCRASDPVGFEPAGAEPTEGRAAPGGTT